MMNRDSLEPEVLECVERIERSVETLYLEWFFHPHRDIRRFDFTYRIELDRKGEEKYHRIRIRSGSFTNRRTFYIGPAEPALKACVFLRNILCDTAIMDMQKILSRGDFDFWFYKNAPANVKYPFDSIYIMQTVIALCQKIKPASVPLAFDIDDLAGFFIEESPQEITYKRLECSIDLLEDIDFEQSVNKALHVIIPDDSTCSFNLSQCVGRYWKGDFKSDPYLFYLDIGWDGAKYALRLLNIAGFPTNRKEKPAISTGYPFLKLPR